MRSGNHRYTLIRAARDWWSERAPKLGIMGAVRQLMREMYEFVRDSTPERKRLRYGDIDYDWEHRVDTTEATVSNATRFLGTLAISLYQPTEPALFHQMIAQLPIDHREFTFVDIGAGKGRTLLMASDYPFQRILGVELFEELNHIAKENIRRYKAERQKCFAIESQCLDAREFVFPQEPLVVYLFNPLPENSFRRVIDNLELSLQQKPREIYIVYHNPEHRVFLDRVPWREFAVTGQFAIYRTA